jgi:signal transduction histidine kinase
LHPPLLDETGLTAAVSWYIDGLRERSGLDIQFSTPDSFPRLPQELELVIFRVLQECLTNIHRHSGSKTAAIRIVRDSDLVKIEVQDQGKGMSPERLAQIQSQGSGVGIRGMRERVRQFEGTVNIESGSTGTRITVTIPVPPSVQENVATREEPQAAI